MGAPLIDSSYMTNAVETENSEYQDNKSSYLN